MVVLDVALVVKYLGWPLGLELAVTVEYRGLQLLLGPVRSADCAVAVVLVASPCSSDDEVEAVVAEVLDALVELGEVDLNLLLLFLGDGVLHSLGRWPALLLLVAFDLLGERRVQYDLLGEELVVLRLGPMDLPLRLLVHLCVRRVHLMLLVLLGHVGRPLVLDASPHTTLYLPKFDLFLQLLVADPV